MPWDKARWPNFKQTEIECKCCGLFIIDEHALDCLQKLRNLMGKALTVDSAVRCVKHNKECNGAENSMHLYGRAFDIALGGHDKQKLRDMAKASGFTGFGYGATFLHVDTGKDRWWDYGPPSRKVWKGIKP